MQNWIGGNGKNSLLSSLFSFGANSNEKKNENLNIHKNRKRNRSQFVENENENNYNKSTLKRHKISNSNNNNNNKRVNPFLFSNKNRGSFDEDDDIKNLLKNKNYNKNKNKNKPIIKKVRFTNVPNHSNIIKPHSHHSNHANHAIPSKSNHFEKDVQRESPSNRSNSNSKSKREREINEKKRKWIKKTNQNIAELQQNVQTNKNEIEILKEETVPDIFAEINELKKQNKRNQNNIFLISGMQNRNININRSISHPNFPQNEMQNIQNLMVPFVAALNETINNNNNNNDDDGQPPQPININFISLNQTRNKIATHNQTVKYNKNAPTLHQHKYNDNNNNNTNNTNGSSNNPWKRSMADF